jgi:hypothetical protein
MADQNDRRPRRFSEGMEHMPDLAASARTGSFADGMARAVDGRAGTFADGQMLWPEAPAARRIGTFADSLTPPARVARGRSRARVVRGPARPQQA